VLDLLTDVVGLADGRCSYAEARHVAERREDLEVRNGAVDEATGETVEGIGVRVRVGGAWGFAATADVSPSGAEEALERALAFAAAQPAGADRPLTAVEPARGSWASQCEIDPFAVSLEEKLALLAAADEALRGDSRIARSHARLTARRLHKHFVSTEGAALEQVTVQCGAGLQAIALDDNDLQVRSYPTGHGGDTRAAGWEHILALDLVGEAPRVAAEAVALLSAPA
jgi:TldD protein